MLVDGQAQNGNGFRLDSSSVFSIHSDGTRRKVPRYNHARMDIRNGVTHLWLSVEAEQVASRMPRW
jgi:hypothetical protein